MNGLIIILGAGPGISQAVAQKFGRESYRIALVARNELKLQEQVVQLQAEGIDAFYHVADVGNEESLVQTLDAITAKAGQADMILFNASFAIYKDILELDWDSVKRNLDICAGGCFHMMKWALPHCLEQNKGKLFVTGGGLALGGDPNLLALSMGKAALRNMVQAFQKRVAGTNVHIAQVTVCGFVNPDDPKFSPAMIAEEYWRLYCQQPGEFEQEIIYK